MLLSRLNTAILTSLRSTSLASIAWVAQNGFRESPAYKVSKTALNMLTALYAQEYATHGFTFLAVNPGVRDIILSHRFIDLT
jgi:NAD(P)-dependent dehydrogenase (short-subunit alcohol dehydrogenase family)